MDDAWVTATRAETLEPAFWQATNLKLAVAHQRSDYPMMAQLRTTLETDHGQAVPEQGLPTLAKVPEEEPVA
ncbi:MAG: hypothetical protein AAGA48_00820 [Myxococcota bacterium]